MSNWKDAVPTKILGGGKKTKKLDGGQQSASQELGNSGKMEGIPETVNLRQEEGAMGGVNIHFPSDPVSSPAAMTSQGDKTVFFRPRKNVESGTAEQSTATTNVAVDVTVSEQPITGWLVIIKGKGKGHALPLSYGLLKIGRDSSQEVPLDFGDTGISRFNHASIEYDKKTRKFYLSKGENLVYLNGDRVGQGGEKEVVSGDEVEIGDDTVLRFISFCGPGFDWNEA